MPVRMENKIYFSFSKTKKKCTTLTKTIFGEKTFLEEDEKKELDSLLTVTLTNS